MASTCVFAHSTNRVNLGENLYTYMSSAAVRNLFSYRNPFDNIGFIHRKGKGCIGFVGEGVPGFRMVGHQTDCCRLQYWHRACYSGKPKKYFEIQSKQYLDGLGQVDQARVRNGSLSVWKASHRCMPVQRCVCSLSVLSSKRFFSAETCSTPTSMSRNELRSLHSNQSIKYFAFDKITNLFLITYDFTFTSERCSIWMHQSQSSRL